MILLLLLTVPTIIALSAMALSGKGPARRITWVEFGVLQGVVSLLVTVAYGAAVYARVWDTEIWNGTINSKTAEHQGCCHDYECNCTETCSGQGSSRSCSKSCSRCYMHSYDETYSATATTGDTVLSYTCLPPGTPPPARWSAARVGEPASVEHAFKNYILGNPDTILRRRGLAGKYSIPPYPRVYDEYRAHHLLSDGVVIPDAIKMNEDLAALVGELGPSRQVNVLVVVTSSPDRQYAEALREEWLGGKKNDAILVLGCPEFPKIEWAEVVSWTKAEDFKVSLREDVQNVGTWDEARIVAAIRDNVTLRWRRRHMADFEYLWASIEPSEGVAWTIGIAAAVITLLLVWWFWASDPFGRGGARRPRMPSYGLGRGYPDLRRWR